MNTRRLFNTTITLLLFTMACSVKEEDIVTETVTSPELEFVAESGEEQTKTAFQADEKSIWWSPGDEISIFYGASEGCKFTATNMEEVAKAVFRGTLDAFTGETEAGDFNYFWAVYPYSASVSCDGSSVVANLSDQQEGKAGSFAPNTNIAIAKSLGLSLGFYNACSWFRFSVKKEGVKRVTFRGNNNEDVAGKFSISMDSNGIPTAPTVVDGKKEIVLTMPEDATFATGQMYYITLLPQVFQNGFTVTFETDTETGSRSINVKATYLRSKYNTGIDFDKDIVYTKRPGIFEYVDMGLSVKWATFNVGATKPEEYGDYYAWGETSTYYYYNNENSFRWSYSHPNGYDWFGYKWISLGQETTNIKRYCPATYNTYMYRWTGPDNPDDKTEFSDYNYVDDAARANWQGEWRTPTEAEWSELVNNCTWVWDDNYNGTGIKGCLVTGGRPGYIDRSIFLPAAGYYSRTANNYQNYDGHYWASSLNVSQPDNAWYLGFYLGSIYLQHASRPGGRSIRPVIE